MKVRDKNVGALVDVFEPACLGKRCYWPRTNPGSFVQGRGYSGATNDWLCGTRQIHGCPANEPADVEITPPEQPPEKSQYAEIEQRCRKAFEEEDGYRQPDHDARYTIFRDGFFAATVRFKAAREAPATVVCGAVGAA